MDYNETLYWSSRPDPNANDGWSREKLQPIVDWIYEHAKEADTVLEFGPGVGRTFTAYNNEQKVVGLDITDRYHKRAGLRAEEAGLTYEHMVNTGHPGGRLPFPDDSFDVAVTAQVLMHIRPENIEPVMLELARVARKVVVITAAEGDAPHVFTHDYAAIIQHHGLGVGPGHSDDGMLFFTYGRTYDRP